MNWKSFQSFWIVCFLILEFFGNSLWSKDNKPVSVVIGSFQPWESPADKKGEIRFLEILKDSLESSGFQVTVSTGNTSENLELAKDSDFYLEGYYQTKDSWTLYGQLYQGSNGQILDALQVANLEIDSQIQGLSLDSKEIRRGNEEIWKEFAKKIAIRMKTNRRKVVRTQNLIDSLQNTPIAKAKNFGNLEQSNVSETKEVFQFFSEQNVSVASNLIKEADKQPVSVTVISRKQIQLSGARTLNELLMVYVPGYFKVEDQDDTIAGFRGLAPDSNSKVLLLLNGTNMNTEWQFGPPDSILNSMNLDYIEKIEVIRGPGSVTLGQGALLGVINIITKTGTTYPQTSIQAGAGKDGFRNYNIQAGANGSYLPELKSYFYISKMEYEGQRLRSEGWTRQRAYEGSEIQGLEVLADPRENQGLRLNSFQGIPLYANIAGSSGNRLHQSKNEMVHGVLEYKTWKLHTFFADQTRDLYNFYRDRNEATSQIRNVSLSREWDLSEKTKLKVNSFYTQDDFGFQSHRGVRLAGTRENRYGGSAILTMVPFSGNSLAIGTEFRKYDMGQRDEQGNNFIVNRAEPGSFFNLTPNTASPFTVNETNRFVFTRSIAVSSLFMESVQKISDQWDLFVAFRYDKHPFWGNNISPRAGTIYSPTKDWKIRFSYQEGFRGAVGVSYTGGYQKDGLLRNENFNQVALARVPNRDAEGNPTFFGNVPSPEPEKMRSLELASSLKTKSQFSLNGVLFYNMIENVIDVGVIYPNPDTNPAPRIGTDEPGDWKGYFFFRNTPGILRQGGTEVSANYSTKWFSTGLSYALVRVINASRELHSSQYLTSDQNQRHFKAYPEEVFRAHVLFQLKEKWSLQWNHLYYTNWFAPTGANVQGMHMANASLLYLVTENMEAVFSVKNALDSRSLFPINSVAGDVSLAAGTPSYEGRTYWMQFRYSF